jgi:bile acid:Na+ symporter, BASS family
MEAIDQAEFYFSQSAGIAFAVMVGFLVFAVSLDLTGQKFRRVLQAPKAPAIGLVAQLVVLPAVAFAVGMLLAGTPSIAIGLLLVTCCPGGALSNYLTGVAKGDVATSISMTAVSTIVCIVVTPLLFAFWVSLNPATAQLLREIDIDGKRVVLMLMVMLAVLVAAGMLIRASAAARADRMRKWVRRFAMLVFGTVVALVLGANLELLSSYAVLALSPIVVTFAIAVGLGWLLARSVRLIAAERRAVAIEVAMQNVALAIAMAVAFFPSLAGVAVTAAMWGVVLLTLGSLLAAAWARLPLTASVTSPAS